MRTCSVAVLLVVLILACEAPAPTPTATPEPKPTPDYAEQAWDSYEYAIRDEYLSEAECFSMVYAAVGLWYDRTTRGSANALWYELAEAWRWEWAPDVDACILPAYYSLEEVVEHDILEKMKVGVGRITVN